ncbi:MAG TPA: TIGR03435 family protein [Acidobacteriaceae bacterium]|nr:TIGR03435 family protein [Acidobacteriaceae bacterium]
MIRFRTLLAPLALLVLTPAMHGQLVLPRPGETAPSFEVATIKPSSRDLGRSFHTHIWWNDNTYSTENTTLGDLIRNAFHISSTQLSGGSDDLLNSRWDVSAKMGEEDFAHMQKLSLDDRDRVPHLMLQALLADRFGLKFHTETRELPVFELVVDKGGAKLQPVPAPEAASAAAPSKVSAPAEGSPAPTASAPPGSTTMRIGLHQASMTTDGGSVAALVATLDRQSELDGRTIVDKTGLTGRYSYSLHWSPQRLNAQPDPEADGPPLFTALREQLGLRLEPAKAPVQIVVIDAIANPTPN